MTKIMKSEVKTNSIPEKGRIMTLRGYYNSLPEATHPKTDLLRSIAKKCDVSETTVRNWIRYGFKPNKKEHVQILSEMTGIPVENLWAD